MTNEGESTGAAPARDANVHEIPIRTISSDGGLAPGERQEHSHEGLDPMEEEIRQALDKFRQKMYTSNKKFINDRIKEIEEFNLPDERAKLNVMARFWFKSEEWPNKPYHPQTPKYMKDQRLLELAVTRLEQVKDLPHPYMDGIGSFLLLKDGARKRFLEELEEISNEYAKTDEKTRIRASKELDIFLKYASGVHDPDFRYQAMCAWAPATACTSDDQDFRASPDLCLIELEELEFGQDEWYSPITKVAFEMGLNCTRNDFYWKSYYAYCLPKDYETEGDSEDGQDSNDDWAWRIVFYTDMCDDLNENPHVFNTIPDFLEWYGSWADRLDVHELHKTVYKNRDGYFRNEVLSEDDSD